MPTLVLSEPCVAVPTPRHKQWTREECARLHDLGMLEEGRYELIEGELIDRMGMKRPHAISLTLVNDAPLRIFGEGRTQRKVPVDVRPEDDPVSEPQPDVIALHRSIAAYDESESLAPLAAPQSEVSVASLLP